MDVSSGIWRLMSKNVQTNHGKGTRYPKKHLAKYPVNPRMLPVENFRMAHGAHEAEQFQYEKFHEPHSLVASKPVRRTHAMVRGNQPHYLTQEARVQPAAFTPEAMQHMMQPLMHMMFAGIRDAMRGQQSGTTIRYERQRRHIADGYPSRDSDGNSASPSGSRAPPIAAELATPNRPPGNPAGSAALAAHGNLALRDKSPSFGNALSHESLNSPPVLCHSHWMRQNRSHPHG